MSNSDNISKSVNNFSIDENDDETDDLNEQDFQILETYESIYSDKISGIISSERSISCDHVFKEKINNSIDDNDIDNNRFTSATRSHSVDSIIESSSSIFSNISFGASAILRSTNKHTSTIIKTTSSSLKKLQPAPMFRLLPTWNKTFGTTMTLFRSVAYRIPRNIQSIRLITDHGVPSWLPNLPSNISCRSTTSPIKGEWFYPKQLHSHTIPTILDFTDTVDIPNNQDEISPTYILYFHGGAFCCCNTATHRGLLMRISYNTGAIIFAVDYRRPPESPYPAPVDDCLAAYKWLLKNGIKSDKILFAGDSAGGGLTISTILKASELCLSIPAGGILLSPWVDLEDTTRDSWNRNKAFDYLPADLALLFANSYRGEYSFNDISVSKSKKLNVLPPLLVEVGSAEVLMDQIIDFCASCIEQGVEVNVTIAEHMVHVFPLFHFTGMKQCEESFQRISKFVLDRIDPTISV